MPYISPSDATYVKKYNNNSGNSVERTELKPLQSYETPIDWQLETMGENYDSTHKLISSEVQKHLFSDEDVSNAQEFYYDLADKNIPLATIGATLTDLYKPWLNMATDPVNVVTSIPSGGVSTGLNIIKKGSKIRYPKDAFKVTASDAKDIANYDDFMRALDNSKTNSKYEELSRYKNEADDFPTSYKPLMPEDFKTEMVDNISWPKRRGNTYSETEMVPNEPLYRSTAEDISPQPIVRGTYGKVNTSNNGKSYKGPGVYTAPSLDDTKQYGDKIWEITRQYDPTHENVLQLERTFATTPSKEMRQKLISLFGSEIATTGRDIPIHNYVISATQQDKSGFADELMDLGIDEIQQVKPDIVSSPASAILGNFTSKRK